MEKVTQQQVTSIITDEKTEDITPVWLRLLIIESGKSNVSRQ